MFNVKVIGLCGSTPFWSMRSIFYPYEELEPFKPLRSMFPPYSYDWTPFYVPFEPFPFTPFRFKPFPWTYGLQWRDLNKLYDVTRKNERNMRDNKKEKKISEKNANTKSSKWVNFVNSQGTSGQFKPISDDSV